MKSIVIILISAIFLVTCDKIELPIDPVAEASKPIFELTGSIGNVNKYWVAGKDNVILKTDFDYLAYQTVLLNGVFIDGSCNFNCKNTLRFNLRQKSTDFVVSSNSRSPITLGKKSFYNSRKDTVLIKTDNTSILANSGNAKYKYLWTIKDAKFAETENIVFPGLDAPTEVCLTISHPDGSTAKQCQVVDLNLYDTFPGLKVSLVAVTENKVNKLQARILGKGPFNVSWDNTTAGETSIEINEKSLTHCVKVIDASGNIALDCITLNPGGKIKNKADFSIAFDAARILDITQYNSAELIYTDNNGVIWSTSYKGQPATSVIEILEDLAYDINAAKQPTRKLKIRVDANLYNVFGVPLPFKLTGHTGVAVPK